jgi:Rrf2 family protein
MSVSSRFAVAVHVLMLLARAGGEPLKSERLARSVNTNPVVIRRLLCVLARAGIVTSQTGAAGGSRLARPAAAITLREVYRAVESREAFGLHRQRPNPRCPVGLHIGGVMAGILAEVDGAVDEVLAGKTIASVLEAAGTCAKRGRRGW